jgi:hypothetical protein
VKPLRLEISVPFGWKLLGKCPTCGVAAGEPCRRMGRSGPTAAQTTKPHPTRARLDELVLELTTKLLARAVKRCSAAEIAQMTDFERDWCPEPLPEDEYAAGAV